MHRTRRGWSHHHSGRDSTTNTITTQDYAMVYSDEIEDKIDQIKDVAEGITIRRSDEPPLARR